MSLWREILSCPLFWFHSGTHKYKRSRGYKNKFDFFCLFYELLKMISCLLNNCHRLPVVNLLSLWIQHKLTIFDIFWYIVVFPFSNAGTNRDFTRAFDRDTSLSVFLALWCTGYPSCILHVSCPAQWISYFFSKPCL